MLASSLHKTLRKGSRLSFANTLQIVLTDLVMAGVWAQRAEGARSRGRIRSVIDMVLITANYTTESAVEEHTSEAHSFALFFQSVRLPLVRFRLGKNGGGEFRLTKIYLFELEEIFEKIMRGRFR